LERSSGGDRSVGPVGLRRDQHHRLENDRPGKYPCADTDRINTYDAPADEHRNEPDADAEPKNDVTPAH
jgi:hypothetical protein